MSKIRVEELETLDGGITHRVEDLAGAEIVDKVNEIEGAVNNPETGLDRRVIYVDTIADLQALDTSGLVVGQAASVQGSEFRWDGSEWRPVGAVSVKAFGAKGDGITDDSGAFQTAFSDNSMFEFYIPGGTYKINGHLFSEKTLKVTGAGTLDFSDAPASSSTDPLILIRGYAGSPRNVTQDVSHRDDVIFVDDNSGIAAGDVIEIATPGDDGGFVEPTPATTNGETFLVKGVGGNGEIFLAERVLDEGGFSVENNAIVRKLDMVRDVFFGSEITIKGSGRPASGEGDYGFVIWYARDVKIHCNFEGVDRISLRFDSCYNYEASGCRVTTDEKGESGALNYGIVPGSSSKHGYIFNCYFENWRHAIVTSKLSTALGVQIYGVVRNLHVYKNTVIDSWAAGISTHNDYDQLFVDSNTLVGCARGIEPRERNTYITNNKFLSCGQGVVLNGFKYNLTIESNYSYETQLVTVQSVSPQTQMLKDVIILNNVCVGRGLTLSGNSSDNTLKNITVIGNKIYRPDGRGIDFTSASPLEDSVVENNIVNSSGGDGIAMRGGGNNVILKDNNVQNAGGRSYRVTGSPWQDLHGRGNISRNPTEGDYIGINEFESIEGSLNY